MVVDIGMWAAALSAVLGLAVTVSALVGRAVRHAIRDEVPSAVAAAFPETTRAIIREEVTHVVEPLAAGLRYELHPNRGHSFADKMSARMDGVEAKLADHREALNLRIDSLEAGQRKLFAQGSPRGVSIAEAVDRDDLGAESSPTVRTD